MNEHVCKQLPDLKSVTQRKESKQFIQEGSQINFPEVEIAEKHKHEEHSYIGNEQRFDDWREETKPAEERWTIVVACIIVARPRESHISIGKVTKNPSNVQQKFSQEGSTSVR